MNKAIAVFFMGYSGSGKDTQADLLRQFLESRGESVFWVSTGDILREAVKGGTYAGRMLDKKVMQEGNAAPAFVATWAWADGIMEKLREGQHVIFPSSPRTTKEAQDLLEFAEFFNLEPHPVFIDVKREEAFRRLKNRGRADDTDETINNRLDYFPKQVEPAIRFYRSQPVGAVIVDGNSQEPLVIQEEIRKQLNLA